MDDSVRTFSHFLQPSVEMGKTTAEMCIESIASDGHNDHHQVALCAATIFHPHKGTSNEQL